jgi:hypothetical protein
MPAWMLFSIASILPPPVNISHLPIAPGAKTAAFFINIMNSIPDCGLVHHLFPRLKKGDQGGFKTMTKIQIFYPHTRMPSPMADF